MLLLRSATDYLYAIESLAILKHIYMKLDLNITTAVGKYLALVVACLLFVFSIYLSNAQALPT